MRNTPALKTITVLLACVGLYGCPPGTFLIPGIDGSLGVSAPAAFYYEQSNVPYEIDVSNLGDTDAPPPVFVQVTLSQGVTLASATPADWTCSATWPIYTCEYGATLTSGASLPTLKLALDIGTLEEVKDSVRICTELQVKDDVNPNNNQLCEQYPALAPTAQYDLKVTETLYNAGIQGPNHVAYQVVVENLGPDTVWDPIDLEVELPPGFTITGWSGYSCTASTPELWFCPIGPMGTGGPTQTRYFQVSGEMDAAFTGDATSCATVSAPQDIDLANNESCHTHTWGVPDEFDLEVTGEIMSYPAPGFTGGYKWYIENLGVNATTQALYILIDAPPPGTTLSWVAGIHGDPGSPTNTGNCATVGTQLQCEMNVLFPPGNQQFVWMTYHIPGGYTGNAPACLSIDPLGDTNAANNEFCLDLGGPDPSPATPLLLAKVDPVGAYRENEIGSVSLTMTNVTADDTAQALGDPLLAFVRLPAGVRYSGYDQDAPVFCEAVDTDQGTSLVTCIHDGELPAGESLSFSVAFLPRTSGLHDVCAEVAPRQAGLDPEVMQTCRAIDISPAL